MTARDTRARPAGLTVAAGLVWAIWELAVEKSADPLALEARSGIDPALLVDQDNRIALPNYIALMRAGKELANDPALGLHFGETNNMSRISVVGLIADAGETMIDAFAQLQRY